MSALLALVIGIPTSGHADPSDTIEDVRDQVADARKRSDALYERAEHAAERANEIGEQVAAIDRRLTKLRADVTSQEKDVEALRRTIGRFAAAEYRDGGFDPTVQLVLSKDPDEFLARMSAADAFAGQRSDLLLALQRAEKRLLERKLVQEDQLARYREAKATATEQMKAADAKAAAAKAILDDLTAEQKRLLAEQERQRQAARERAARAAERAEQEEAEEESGGDSDAGGSSEEPAPPPPSGDRGAVALAYAKTFIGVPYVFGGESRDGIDCSGLTMVAWAEAGVSLPHSAHLQYEVSTKISQSELQLGDLVLFYSDLHHVGLYAGNGMVLHASRPGEPVGYIKMSYMPYAGAARPG